MPAFFDLDREDEQESESRQPVDGWSVPLVEGQGDGKGWQFKGPLVTLWRWLRGKRS